MARRQSACPWCATALVHEAYLKMAGRANFNGEKRGGDQRKVPLDEALERLDRLDRGRAASWSAIFWRLVRRGARHFGWDREAGVECGAIVAAPGVAHAV